MGQHLGTIQRALLMMALVGTCRTALAQADAQKSDPALPMVDALYGCFRGATDAANQGDTKIPFGPSTESFFFEQLGAAMQVLGNAPQLTWCTPWFVQPYLRAHTALHGPQASAPSHDPKLPLSTGVHFAQESRLIHLASRMGGVSHVSAHADIMRHALSAPRVARELGRLRLNMCARGLLMQGAQVPDLYLFDQPLWHAQSQQGASASGSAVGANQVAQSETAFVALVVNTVRAARAAALAGDLQQAMVLLGAAAHAVQDLSYHRGMTQSEKSGLTYVAHSNPDLPHEPKDQELARAAIAATADMLVAAFAPLPSRLAQDLHVVAEDSDALAALVVATWPEAEPVDYVVMRRYFGLSLRYKQPAPAILAMSLAQANAGRWQPASTLKAILAAL